MAQKSAREKVPTQIVGNVGMYYLCYKLSQMGYNVMPTARNARGIDIVVYDNENHFVGVQVKTLSKGNAVPLGKTLRAHCADIWVIITNVMSGDADIKIYVMTPKEIEEHSQHDTAYWLESKEYCKYQDQKLSKFKTIFDNLITSGKLRTF